MTLKDIGSLIIPRGVKPFFKKMWRDTHRWKVNHFSLHIQKNELITGFRKLGLQKGDVIWVHGALSSFGFIEGGAETLISALRDSVTGTGTIIMPAYPGHGGEKAYLKRNPLFDSKTTPSMVGKITDAFWRKKDSIRSIHPAHSIAASGPLAEEITRDHEKATTEYGRDTPFFKALEANAKVVLLGVDVQFPTFYHTFEDLRPDFPYEVYAKEKIDARWVDDSGNIHVKSVQVHNAELGVFRIDSPRGCGIRKIYRNELKAKGQLKTAKIGNAKCMMFPAHALMEALDTLLSKGITIYHIPSELEETFKKN